MFGMKDQVGVLAVDYVNRHGRNASCHLDSDLSQATGQHRWELAHNLHRVKLRLMRMRLVGYFDNLLL